MNMLCKTGLVLPVCSLLVILTFVGIASADEFPLLMRGNDVVLVEPTILCSRPTNIPDALTANERRDFDWLEELDCIRVFPGNGVEWRGVSLGKTMQYKRLDICEVRVSVPLDGQSVYAVCYFRDWQEIEIEEVTSGAIRSSRRLLLLESFYGASWGFSVPILMLECKMVDGRPHVLVTRETMEYALNGAAMGSGLYRNARELMLKDENGILDPFGASLIDRGLSFCPQ
jgi:hypothetical protein